MNISPHRGVNSYRQWYQANQYFHLCHIQVPICPIILPYSWMFVVALLSNFQVSSDRDSLLGRNVVACWRSSVTFGQPFQLSTCKHTTSNSPSAFEKYTFKNALIHHLSHLCAFIRKRMKRRVSSHQLNAGFAQLYYGLVWPYGSNFDWSFMFKRCRYNL